MAAGAGLAGLRVLVVEDETIVSLMIEDLLDRQGCVVVGPFDRVPEALAAAESAAIDLALLDVNVAGVQVYPVAEALSARGVPFLFLSGYGRTAIPSGRPHWRVCGKPFRPDDLLRMLADQMAVRRA